MRKRERKRPPTELGRAREALGLTQDEAAKRLGFSHKQQLSDIERGQSMPSGRVMREMATLYGLSQVEVLRRAVATFESGRVMLRHLRRKMKLASVKR